MEQNELNIAVLEFKSDLGMFYGITDEDYHRKISIILNKKIDEVERKTSFLSRLFGFSKVRFSLEDSIALKKSILLLDIETLENNKRIIDDLLESTENIKGFTGYLRLMSFKDALSAKISSRKKRFSSLMGYPKGKYVKKYFHI